MKFFKKLIAALTATSLVTVSGFSSVCMAAREYNIDEYYRKFDLNCEYSLEMLKSIDKSIGLTKGGDDGNYFKEGNLSDEEKKIYDKIVNEVKKIKDSVDKDDSSNLSKDCKLAKAIFFWVRNNIKYDKESVSLPAEANTFEDKLGVKKTNENRKPQDALTVFKNGEGVCEGISKLAQLMMKISGLPCVCVGNHEHSFNAVWLGENPGGWALFDATAEPKEIQDQEDYFYKGKDEDGKDVKEKYNNSFDNMILDEKFPAVYKYESSTLEESNKLFISADLFMTHLIYVVSDNLAGIYKNYLNDYNGVYYMLSPKILIVTTNNNSISVDEKMLQYKPRCTLAGNIKNIENFDVFYKNFVRVDISQSQINKTIKQGDFEFNLSADGKKSKLEIKPSENGKNFDTVTIPNELIPFLSDIDEFKVDSNIKTVKYDFLWKEQAFKKNVILPKDVKFEQIDLIK